MKAIVTVIGKDKPGIIAAVSGMLAGHNINIEDISQTVLQGNFTMIMLVSMDRSRLSITELSEATSALSHEVGVEIHVQKDGIRTERTYSGNQFVGRRDNLYLREMQGQQDTECRTDSRIVIHNKYFRFAFGHVRMHYNKKGTCLGRVPFYLSLVGRLFTE